MKKTNHYTVDIPKTGWFYRCDDYEKMNDAISVNLFPRFPNIRPLRDPRFHLKIEHKTLFLVGLFVMTSRQSNCGGMSCLLAKYLWENNAGINRIEVVTTTTFDHCMVIVNRSGDLKDPDTWGDAWIVDAWYGKGGIIFHAKEFKTKIETIKDLAKVRQDKVEIIGGGSNEVFLADKKEVLEPWIEINPDKDEYPTYSKAPFYPIEYYYDIENGYPRTKLTGTGKNPLHDDLMKHREKFQRCLRGVCFFSSKDSSRSKPIGEVSRVTADDFLPRLKAGEGL